MFREVGVLLLLVLAIGAVGFAQTAVTPQAADGVLLFDNTTGAEAVRLGILFDGPTKLCATDITAFGGGAVTRLDVGTQTAWIDAKVVDGGTLQVNTSGGAKVKSAYWVSSAQEKSKVICRWVIEAVWNDGDLAAIPEFVASDSLFHGDQFVAELTGVEGYAMFAANTHTAWPDVHFTIDALVAQDDMVALRASYAGTNTGPLGTIPATGLPITCRAMLVHRFNDGKIQEGWMDPDALGMLMQIGVLPPMGPPNFTWGTPSTVTGDPGTPEQNKIISEDYVGHYDMSTTTGREAYKQYLLGLFVALPDVHITVERVFAEGDLVAFVALATGTQLGPFGPAPASGKPMQVRALVIRRMAYGKIVELWQLNDMLGMLMQIVLVPPLQ